MVYEGAELPAPWQLLVKGTTFQLKVWQALLTIPCGGMISYQDLAVQMGHPTACRAVAGAVAANPIGYLVPCRRVIRKSGEFHKYRLGSSRKKAMRDGSPVGYEIHF
ncbi:MAG: methylated-DNA--[protein]-cysteine S-methyltransferase [Pseudomonadota bacterium]